ncbi:TPR-like protein [Lentinula edodes]|uniref:TPR-like protein n=1 Tax=Lentinula edodes TaxID=5353 RepID=A0A1Q3ERW2_LENED|nr:TPR-like protein [Lentinula edodes]
MSSSSGDSHLIRYYSKLIETYIQLSLYEEAEATATRVLAVDPSNLIVRLKRGHARRRAGHLAGALADFETVLSIPPKPDTAQALHYDEALRQRDIVVDVLGCSYLELAYAHPSEIAEYNAPSISPSSIEARSGIPLRASLDEPLPTNCRFYNHLGCRRGKKCLFSHAPDTRSIRDDLGKNVCLYHLVGKCKWDSFTCIYSHSKDNLPSEHVMENDTSKVAWWTNPARIETVRQLIEKRDARRKKIHEQIERAKKRNIDNNKKSKKRDNNSDNKDSGDRLPDTNTTAGNRPAYSSSSSNSNCDETLVIDWESDSESEGELQFEDVESPNMDLLSYGIKPWEHEEAKALAVALDNLHT